MNAIANAAAAGAVGAITTNALHELTRRSISDAPRVDLLGMQALSKMLASAGAPVPTGRALYGATLAGDLLSNAAYFSGVAAAANPVLAGLVLGAVAGIGAVALPRPMGLSTEPTARSARTALLTAMLYTAGGLASGVLYSRLRE